MKKILLLFIAAAMMFYMTGCIKTSNLVPTLPNDPNDPDPTEIGTPVGDAVSKSIGKDGGSIVSADGNAELIFPAGALASATDISIQAITNTAPNGFGNSYSFLPERIHFLQPVTLKFHYTAETLASTLAGLMGIAFQDSIGQWYRVMNFTNDTVNKIISAPIKHFSKWAPFLMLKIFPPNSIVSVNKSLDLNVEMVESDDHDLVSLANEEVVPLKRRVTDKKIVWSVNGTVNGSPTYGSIAATTVSGASFHAPSKAPPASHNPVAVSAVVDVPFYYGGQTWDKTTLISNVRIIDTEVYLVEISIVDTAVDFDPYFIIVHDSASMLVTIKDEVATVSDIRNFAPYAMPDHLEYGRAGYYLVPDPNGQINITGATGRVSPFLNPNDPGITNSRLMGVILTHTGTVYPKIKYVADDGTVDYSGGQSFNGYPLAWSFELLADGEFGDGADLLNGDVLDKFITVTITRQNN